MKQSMLVRETDSKKNIDNLSVHITNTMQSVIDNHFDRIGVVETRVGEIGKLLTVVDVADLSKSLSDQVGRNSTVQQSASSLPETIASLTKQL